MNVLLLWMYMHLLPMNIPTISTYTRELRFNSVSVRYEKFIPQKLNSIDDPEKSQSDKYLGI